MFKDTIPTPKMSEILSEEFMKPLNLSAYAVAKAIDVPTSRILDILHDKRKVTVDTSVRLGKLFGVSPKFFLNIQNDIELRNAEMKNSKEYAQIK
ncbi:HigA family addiction module antitoxin [Lactobacillus crispatus]|nr:HigA family addiction module antitoxin [Lactobacillus crispatus]MBM6873808.1 HigA family addiction module antidote protein [Lactobacillus crispatus]